MANISSLLEIIRTAHLGRDMRQALHDAIEDVNDDTETALGKTLAFNDTTRKLTLKAKDNSVLSEATIPGGTSGSTVSWNQIKTSGEKIATITIDNNSTDVYASAGGGGGGGAVDSVNGQTGDVVLDADDISDTNTTNKFVTATEKSTWNGKQDALTFTSTPSSSNKVVCQNDLSGGGHTIKNESGTALTQRDNLQFKGCAVSDDSTNNATVVSVQTSNRNLLDNAWFTVNQKGNTSGDFTNNAFIVDRWKTSYGNNANNRWTLSNGILTLDTTLVSSTGYLIHILENQLELGKRYTFSILYSDGTVKSFSQSISSGTSSFGSDDNWYNIQYAYSTSTLTMVLKAGKTVSIKAFKLELGSQSTLAFDTAPDYTTELLKCQRYLQKVTNSTIVCMRSLRNDKLWWGEVELPVPMRTTPTFTYTSATIDAFNSSYSYIEETCTISINAKDQSIDILATSSTVGAAGSCGAVNIVSGWLDAQL